MPERFYTRLLQEQKSSPERITIGGQSFSELVYNFMNYRHSGALNINDAWADSMHMTCDYAIAWKREEPYYKPYYDEMDLDKDWGMVLLKRKEKIKRTLLMSLDSLKLIEGSGEYYNLLELKDTAFASPNPLLAEISLGDVQAEMPLQAWLVMEIDSAEGKAADYRRVPMNWIRYDWTGLPEQKLDLVGGRIPHKIHRLVCYVWNLEKKKIKIRINSLKLYRLDGNGVNILAPARLKNIADTKTLR
jgi:hypothetical protein